METEPSEHAQSSHADPITDPAKSISFPEPTCLLVTVLVLIKRYVGSGNEISMKGRAKVCVWKTHLSHFYVLQTTIKFGEVNVFPWSIFYGKQTFPGDASLRVCSEFNACTTANLNIVDLVEFYGCLCSLCYWKHFTEQFKGTLGS